MVQIQRHFEGGNAIFGPGCVLTGYFLNANVRVTIHLSVKADANSVLIHWRPSSVDRDPNAVRDTLKGFGPLRFFQRAASTFGSLSRRGYWSNVAGYYQPEHALAAVRHFSGIPQMEATLLYTAYFTVSKELADVVLLDVDDIISQTQHVDTAWDDRRQNVTMLRISGPNRETIVDLKRILEAIFSGKVASKTVEKKAGCEIWHDFFAGPQGDIWLQHLGRDTGLIIVSDRAQRRLRIYDPDPEAGDGDEQAHVVEMKLAEKVTELNLPREAHTISLDRNSLRKLISSDTVAKLQKLLGATNVSLDIVSKKLVLYCSRDAVWLATYQLDLPLPPPTAQKPPQACPVCSDITSEIQLSCGHVSCRECFDHQLNVASGDLSSHHFPVRCWHENCQHPLSILDLRRYAPGTMIDSLLKASLTYFIRSHPDEYRNCRKPDCASVYLRNGYHEIFTCPACLTQTCTLCHSATHVGWTCAQYQERVKKDEVNERLLDSYKASAGTKDCPKCGTLIEKIDGCNHMECSGCHAHVCWQCLKFFSRPDRCYDHMNLVHGGDGLEAEGDEEGEWSDDSEDEFDNESDDEVYEASDDDYWFW